MVRYQINAYSRGVQITHQLNCHNFNMVYTIYDQRPTYKVALLVWTSEDVKSAQ